MCWFFCELRIALLHFSSFCRWNKGISCGTTLKIPLSLLSFGFFVPLASLNKPQGLFKIIGGTSLSPWIPNWILAPDGLSKTPVNLSSSCLWYLNPLFRCTLRPLAGFPQSKKTHENHLTLRVQVPPEKGFNP